MKILIEAEIKIPTNTFIVLELHEFENNGINKEAEVYNVAINHVLSIYKTGDIKIKRVEPLSQQEYLLCYRIMHGSEKSMKDLQAAISFAWEITNQPPSNQN